MKRTALGYLFLVTTLCVASTGLHASSMLAGHMCTVGPYGPQDAARNPALLSAQESTNALGLAATYQALPSSDVDITQFQPINIRPDITSYHAGNARVSYARAIDPLTLGFDCYYNMQSTERSSNIIAFKGNFVIGQGSTGEKNLSSLLTLALSAALAPSHSLGIRLNCSYVNNQTREITRIIQVSLPPVYLYSREMTLFEEVSTLPCIGYFGKFGAGEIGLMVTTGRLAWKQTIKEGLKYDMSSIMNQLLFKAKGKLPYRFSYNMGPSLLAGFRARPSYTTGIGLEIGFSLPVAYRDHYLINGDQIGSIIGRFNYFTSGSFGLENRVLTKPSVSIRGGCEFAVSRTITFNVGAGFGYNAPLSSATGLYPAVIDIFFSDYKIISALGTAGFDFLVGKNSTLTVGAALSYFALDQTQSPRQTLNFLGTKIKMKNLSLDCTAALSVGF